MWKIVFLCLYLVVSAVHLYGCAMHDQRIRNITKPLLMPALAAFYICSADPVNWLVVALIMTSFIGDVLLMIHGMKWFTSGGISFLLTHVLLIVLYIPHIRWSPVDLIIVVPYLILGFGVLRSGYIWMRRYLPKTIICMMTFYLGMNTLMNLFAALQAFSDGGMGSELILFGALLFLASDSILFLVRFDKKLPFYGKHFNVMLTYTLAKLLIVTGFILM
ncbi:MAG: lysoplasmalogenase [Lachnospiraceae bacterium]|nr:lysoplasmalogenase [Lachnospiraceae bacterium]